MKLPVRELFRDVALYGVGDLLLKATAFISLPIYTNIFRPEEYGVWSLVVTITGLVSGILILGGESAYGRFFFEAKTMQEKQVITSTWLGFLGLWSAVVIALCLPFSGLFSEWLLGTGEHGALFLLAFLAVPAVLVNTMCGQILRNQFRPRLFIVLNVLTTVLTIGLGLFAAIVLDMGLLGVLGGALLGTVIMLPIRLLTAREMFRPVFSPGVLRHLLAYGAPLVPMTLAYWVFGISDRILIGKLSSLEQLGLYAVAYSVAGIMGFANSALGQAWSAHAVRVYEEQPKLAPVFFGQVMTYLLAGFGILCVGITAFAHELVVIMSAPAFYPAAAAIGPLALGYVAYASTQITASGISITKKTGYFSLFAWIAALLNVFLNILLVPVWGMLASAWATALSYLFLTLAYLFTSQRLWRVVYEKRPAFVAVALTIAFTLAASILPNVDLIFSIPLKMLFCLAFGGFLILFRVIDLGEWNSIVKALRGARAGRVREVT